MPWSVGTTGEGARLALAGVVDIFEAAPLHEALLGLAARSPVACVDLSACADLDASALQLLLAFRRDLEARGGRVVFAWEGERLSRLLGRFGIGEAREETVR